MSNKTIGSVIDLDSNEVNFNSSDDQGSSIPLGVECTHCGATQVANSRIRPADDFKMRFIAKRPYRCLNCYSRFWVVEKFTDNPKRVWTLAIIGLLVVFLLLGILGVFNSSTPKPTTTSVVVPEFNSPDAPVVEPETAAPKLASLVDMPKDDNGSEVSGSAQTNVQVSSNSPQAIISNDDDLLTPEQKARRLLRAKQESEAAQRISEARVEQLERVLLPAEDELESLVKIEVGYAVERWRETWSKGDAQAYLSNYSADFTPANDLTYDEWLAGRKYRVKPEKNISVELSDFDITLLEGLNSGVVEFNQRYQSGSYIDNSRKRLELIKKQETWKIISEAELK